MAGCAGCPTVQNRRSAAGSVAFAVVPRSTTWSLRLATACLVSVVSGFFDGGLGNAELSAGLAAYQYFLLAVTTAVGVLAIRRAVAAVR